MAVAVKLRAKRAMCSGKVPKGLEIQISYPSSSRPASVSACTAQIKETLMRQYGVTKYDGSSVLWEFV